MLNTSSDSCEQRVDDHQSKCVEWYWYASYYPTEVTTSSFFWLNKDGSLEAYPQSILRLVRRIPATTPTMDDEWLLHIIA